MSTQSAHRKLNASFSCAHRLSDWDATSCLPNQLTLNLCSHDAMRSQSAFGKTGRPLRSGRQGFHSFPFLVFGGRWAGTIDKWRKRKRKEEAHFRANGFLGLRPNRWFLSFLIIDYQSSFRPIFRNQGYRVFTGFFLAMADCRRHCQSLAGFLPSFFFHQRSTSSVLWKWLPSFYSRIEGKGRVSRNESNINRVT